MSAIHLDNVMESRRTEIYRMLFLLFPLLLMFWFCLTGIARFVKRGRDSPLSESMSFSVAQKDGREYVRKLSDI